MSHDHIAALSSIPLFSTLGYRECEVLASFLSPAAYKSGRSIVREGESGGAFYVVTQGSVEVTQDGATLSVLGAGDFFGELAIQGDGVRTATVTAQSDVELWVMLGEDLRRLELEHPEVSALLQNAVDKRK